MSDIHSDVGSYVADSLSDAERAAFEEHLAVCETCAREVREFSETAADLGVLTQSPPPPELRASVLEAIGSVRPLPPVEDAAPRRAAPEEERHEVEVPRDEVAVARQRRVQRVLQFAVAAAVVVALALGGAVYNLTQQVQSQVAQQEAQEKQRRAETELMAAPDAVVRSATIDGRPGTYVVSAEFDRGLFIASDLPPAGTGRTYQLWTQHGDDMVGSGLFDGGESVRAWIDNIDGAAGFAITIEPAGGSPNPTGDEIMAEAKI